MPNAPFTLQQEEILVYVKIESFPGKGVPEILIALQDVDPYCSFGFGTVCRWLQELKSGRSELLLKHTSGYYHIK